VHHIAFRAKEAEQLKWREHLVELANVTPVIVARIFIPSIFANQAGAFEIATEPPVSL
jgi:hypothetical protein